MHSNTKWLSIDLDFFGQIPISKSKNPEIETLVTKILTQKKSNPEADTSDLEAEIDQLVYALYDLTAAEIAIIEKG